MRRIALSFAFLATLLGLGLQPIAFASAQNEGLILECDRVVLNGDGTVNQDETKRCGVEQFVGQFVRLAQYGITIVLFIAVLMMVYGGFEFITAGGRASKISSGQNIMTGTIIGLVISFSAYVIINFSIGAITGTKTSTNPLTAISTVFGRPEQQEEDLTKPFSGIADSKSVGGCRTAWDNTCANQVLCADDPDDGLNGQIATWQGRLKGFGCGCEVDGCFGAGTAQCIRRFQIANELVPTGTITEATTDALLQANPQRCDGGNAGRVKAVVNNLPQITHNVAKNLSATNTGCCVVHKTVSGTPTPLYCINDLSERGCAALGSGYVFASGKACTQDAKTIPLCGYCKSIDNKCFEEAGKYWCEQVAKDPDSGIPLTFQKGVCRGGGICGECLDTLKTTP